MTRVAILPVQTGSGRVYHAIAGDRRSEGRTAGAALDALTPQLPQDESATLVVLQNPRPDRFFNAEQCRRLEELLTAARQARDSGGSLDAARQAELEALVEAELTASAARAAALADEPGR